MLDDIFGQLVLAHLNSNVVRSIKEVNVAFDIVSGAALRCLQNEVMLRRIVHS